MTQEHKQLLLKDLSARLPYGVKMKYKNEEGASTLCQIDTLYTDVDGFHCLIRMAEPPGIFYDLTEFKPYLRPMSSMTEEEKKTYKSFFSIGEYACGGTLYGKEYEYINSDSEDISESISLLDWLNEHHFDYRGLIPMGLALEAPEGMYKTE